LNTKLDLLQMTASQRIKHIIKTKNITIKDFCNRVGINRDTLGQMVKNDSDPKLPLLQACIREFPDLNPIWLLMGEGEMWKDDEATSLDLAKDIKEMKEQLNKIGERLENKL